jgi:hypothetical protein
MNSDGTVVAVGARNYDGPSGDSDDAGHVRVFERGPSSSVWQQKGTDIVGAWFENLGTSVALNDIGDRVVAGALLNGLGGAVKIYDSESTAWVQQTTLRAEAVGDALGWSVATNGVGDIIASGTAFTGTIFNNYVRVWQLLSNGTWVEFGNVADTGLAGRFESDDRADRFGHG